jgi:glutaredoxin
VSARRQAPVLRLTDDDVGHSVDTATESVAGEPAAAPVVTLYSTTWCGWCRKSRQLMQSLDIAFVEKDVESDPRAAAEKARLAPGSGVPVLVRGGEVVRGFSEATIRSWAPAAKAKKG